METLNARVASILPQGRGRYGAVIASKLQTALEGATPSTLDTLNSNTLRRLVTGHYRWKSYRLQHGLASATCNKATFISAAMYIFDLRPPRDPLDILADFHALDAMREELMNELAKRLGSG